MLNWLFRPQPTREVTPARPDGVGLIVGLGNPGPKYRKTRHNLGFMVVERLAERAGFSIDRNFRRSLIGAWQTSTGKLVVAEPQTFMNASGESVATIAQFYQLKPSQVLVICDDTSLAFGRLRVRRSGSEGGHNGLRSISQKLGSQEYPRLRVGIGRPPEKWDLIDYVLGSFTTHEFSELPAILDRAIDAIETAVLEGVDVAMNRFNG